MDIPELKGFLSNFCLPEDKIDEFILNKSIVTKNDNIFLTNKDFTKREVFNDGLIFIKLKILLPSKYILSFIHKNTKPIIIKSQKQALNYTYGKSLSLDSVNKNQQLQDGKYYILESNKIALGYVQYKKTERFPIFNLMNIGEYLKE